jgi:hypothetical protein
VRNTCSECGDRFKSRSGLYTHYLFLCRRRRKQHGSSSDCVKHECDEPHICLSHAGPPPLLALLAGVRGAEGGTEDVQLVCRGGASLPAHRALLAAASPMLRYLTSHAVYHTMHGVAMSTNMI